MKKIFVLFILAVAVFTASAQRWQNPPKDNTGRQLTFYTGSLTLANTDSIAPNASHSYFVCDTLKHAKTIIVKTINAKKWDEVTFEFLCDTLTAGRVVTFSTGNYPYTSTLWTTTSGNTITVKKQKRALVTFLFDGTRWTEQSRNIQY